MLEAVLVLAAAVADGFRPRGSLLAEIALLRHQLAVLQRSVARPRVTRLDRIALVALAAVTPTWRNVLRIVHPQRAARPRSAYSIGPRPSVSMDHARGVAKESIGIVPWIMSGTPVRGTPRVGPRGSIYKYLVRSPRRRRIGRRRCGNSNLDRKTSGTCRRTRSGPRGRHRCSRSTLHLEGVARGDRRQSPPIRRAHRTARS